MTDTAPQRSGAGHSLLIWSSPSTKGAGAYQLWENYTGPITDLVQNVTLLRGHDPDDSFANPQMKINFRSARWTVTGLLNLMKSVKATHVVTSISQSDILYGGIVRLFSKAHWTIYVLGQPYPVKGQTNLVKRAIWKRVWILSARRADRIIAVSDYIAALISADLKNCEIQTVYPSITKPKSAAPGTTTPPDLPLRVGFVGRLSPEKDPALFCRVVNVCPGVDARIYGDGPLRPAVEKVRGKAELYGFRPQDEIYSTLDVLMMTSRSEGLPMVLVEASFRGIVPLVADIGGCAEAIHPENRDILVIAKRDRENLGVWAERIRLLRDVNLRKELLQRQLEWASEKFDLGRNSLSLVNLAGGGAHHDI